MQEGPHAPVEPLVTDALIVPETKPLDDLLADLQRQRTSMAVVVDEYGRVVGVVTVEDIIEEVVGEIADETDPAAGEIRRLADGDWFVRGHVAVTDLADYGLHLPVDSDAYNSIGGFVFARARAPAAPRGHGQRERLLDPRGVRARQPHRGGAHPRAQAGAARGPRRRGLKRGRRRGRCATRAAGPQGRPLKHVRPAGGADRIVCTGRRRVCVATLT